MLVLTGKSASGKNYIRNILVAKYGFEPLITYTTRPMRPGEIQGETYHFIGKEEFDKKVLDGFFAEWECYKTENGFWYYGSAKEDYISKDGRKVVILTPTGAKDIADVIGRENLRVVYIKADDNTIRQRLELRGDNKSEAERRIAADNIDFKNFEKFANKIVKNDLDTSGHKLTTKIVSWYLGGGSVG